MRKKDKMIWIIVLCVAIIACLSVFLWKTRQSGKEGAQVENMAMYVPYGDGEYLMVDQDNGTVFTMSMPKKIYGTDGKEIAFSDLQPGNILKLIGDGIMLESYPGQYPGVVKAEVVEEGKPSDADQYQEIIDGIYTQPDPADPPDLDIRYRTAQADATVMITRGGYSWTYEDEDGQQQSVVADSAHILQWNEIADIVTSELLKLRLSFSVTALEAEVHRWPLKEMGKEFEEIPEGERVSLEKDGDDFILPKAEAGYVYEVDGTWEQGTVSYGFVMKEE